MQTIPRTPAIVIPGQVRKGVPGLFVESATADGPSVSGDSPWLDDAVGGIPNRWSAGTALLREIIASDVDIAGDGFCNPHPNAFTAGLIDVAMASGRKRFHLGVDGLAGPVPSAIHTGCTVREVRRAVDVCRERGAPVSCSLLFGHRGESVDTVRAGRSRAATSGAATPSTLTGRTELAKIAVKEGVLSNSPDELPGVDQSIYST